MSNRALRTFLDATASQQPEYRGGLSNHLPMALHALSDLGASASTLERFEQGYLARTRIGPASADASPVDDWRAARGQLQAYSSLRATFAGLVRQQGRESVVALVLPSLWPGVAAAAFHGVIRVAHAWESGHADELAAGLAFWAARWQDAPAPALPRTMPLADWLTEAKRAALAWDSTGNLIMDRMADATRSAAFHDHAARLAPDDDSVLQAAAWAAGLYAETANFTILHVVTGLRAVHVLASLSPPPPEAWNALFAAIQASGAREREATDPDDRSWTALAADATSARDEHVIKLVHACRQLDALHPDPRFRQAAARVLRR